MSNFKIKAKKVSEKLAENYTKIKIGGFSEIIYGDNVIRCRNKFTRYLMSSIVVIIGSTSSGANTGVNPSGNCYSLSHGATARIGIDEGTKTNPDMSDLVNKVDVAPDSITRRLYKEPGSLYVAEFVFMWNAETLPDIYDDAVAEGDIDGRVGEFGVYLRTDNDDWTTGIVNPRRDYATAWYLYFGTGSDVRLASRIASADNAFDAFEFWGSMEPLTYKWRFQVAIL